jgi:hypothetical protein
MITILLIVACYALTSVAFFTYATRQRNNQVKELIETESGFRMEYTPRQTKLREFWRVISWFSPVWPSIFLGMILLGVFLAFRVGILAIVHLSSGRSEEVQRRLVLRKLEAKKAEIESKSMKSYSDEGKLRDLEMLISKQNGKVLVRK